MALNARNAKIQRLTQGKTARVLDLFSGCGGFSTGFLAAGFEIVGSLEKDPIAAKTHANNFFKQKTGSDEGDFATHARARDITRIRPGKFVKELGLGPRSKAIDVLTAGPPCQSYARIGRAKLCALASNPNAFLHDRRGKLYKELLYYVQVLKPLVVVFENVLDVLNQAGDNIVEHICDGLVKRGYVPRYTILNAAHYGVPQMRERVFLLAYAAEMDMTPEFPTPTHQLELPHGYHGAREVALKSIRHITGDQVKPEVVSEYFQDPPMPSDDLPDAVTTRQALEDLPVITAEMKASITPGPRRFNQSLGYRKINKLPAYANLMRIWKGFESDGVIKDHVIRRLPRDYPIFRKMEPGDQYPEAHSIAENILWPLRMKELGLTEQDGNPTSPRQQQYLEEKRKVVPPYDPTKFIDKWRKMDRQEPARTLTAHLGKDSYTHIHYDDSQARTISVREAARLQSFPDGFQFEGAMNAAFRQIGNAVPPLVAKALALQVMRHLQTFSQSTSNHRADKQLGVYACGDGQSGDTPALVYPNAGSA